jgi:hypothetical protein
VPWRACALEGVCLGGRVPWRTCALGAPWAGLKPGVSYYRLRHEGINHVININPSHGTIRLCGPCPQAQQSSMEKQGEIML